MKAHQVWSWGPDAPDRAETAALAPFVAELTGVAVQEPQTPSGLGELPKSRRLAQLPTSLRELASTEPVDRARHGLGRSYRDVVRGLRGDVPNAADLVLRPREEADVIAVLDWAGSNGVPVVPFGGGSSVVGGVEPVGLDAPVSLDLSRLCGVTEVDPVSRAALVRAGTFGPDLEDALRPHGLTARFYPQSFERSTVGGWLATRAAGHFSTGPTHVDDLVESVRAVTPVGVWESRRLPGSGAGPSPDRALLGSEGTLAVITQAWLRVQPRPVHRFAATLAAPDFRTGAQAVRALLQAGLRPATARLIDPGESRFTGTLDTGEAALVLGLESWHEPVDGAVALALCRQAGLRVVEAGVRGAAGDAWRSTFVRAPYVREHLVLLGVLVETFETAITWDRLDDLVDSVTVAVTDALRRVCGGGSVTCRLTHAYPDGAAPYFTVTAPARRGGELAQWAEVKAAAGEAVLAAGGTITHHHAVGRDHRPWYDRQRPEAFGLALRAQKRALDPYGILNPGVLIP